jgi:hypothetical protein
MKLDMDLVRNILLEVENLPFDGQFHEIRVEGHSEDEITYHLIQLAERGLIVGKEASSMDGKAYFAERLTPEGHTFLEAAPLTIGGGSVNVKTLVTYPGECFRATLQRSQGSYDNERSHEFRVEDLMAERGARGVNLVFTRKAIVNTRDFAAREQLLSWNALRKGFDRRQLSFETEPKDPDRYIELKVSGSDVEAQHTLPDEILREYLIAKAYWIGYKLNDDPDRHWTNLESEEDLDYLGVTKEDLRRIAWRMREEGLLRPHRSGMPGVGNPTMKLIELFEAPKREVVFPRGSQYDAYKQLSQILESANSSITIVDNYVDRTLLDMLQPCKENVAVRVLTKPVKPDFELALKKFKAQFKRTIEVRVNREVHDRYVVVDNKDFYSVGASLKNAGDKLSLLVNLEEPSAIAALRNKIEEIWNRASPL